MKNFSSNKIITVCFFIAISNGYIMGQLFGGQIRSSKKAADIATLECATISHQGNLVVGLAASSVTTTIPYTGGNGGFYSAASDNSTGVAGLTASLASGTLNNGNGNLVLNISGTPSSSGTASFALNIGGVSCTLTRTVLAPTSFTNCAQASAGTMTINTSYTAGTVTQTVRLNVAVAGSYSISTNTVNGVTFSASGTFASTGTQDVVLVASGTPNNSGTLSFTATLSGQAGAATCNFTRYVRPASVARSFSGFGSNGCNGCAQGSSDTRTNGWQDNGGTFNLSGGNYSLSFNVNITANGTVCSGTPNKPLEGRIQVRLRNTSTNATYLSTGGGRTTFSGCTNRGTGSHSAGGNYSGSAGTVSIPSGTYIVQIYGESYMGGCGSGGSDSWAGCGLSSGGGGSISITGQ